MALVGGSPGCVIARATSGTGISIVNATNVGAKNCTVAANSSSATAVDLLNASSLTASNLNVVGNYQAANASTVVTPPTIIKTNAPATKDPYANLAVPSFNTGGCQPEVSVTNSQSKIINSGGQQLLLQWDQRDQREHADDGRRYFFINGGSFSLANAHHDHRVGSKHRSNKHPKCAGHA